ncbi:MAG: DUF1311 domain-containing protein [Magnetococcales bacterium]|nr:DUF1311 domain-containing protein [Magnetococcales bacterium]
MYRQICAGFLMMGAFVTSSHVAQAFQPPGAGARHEKAMNQQKALINHRIANLKRILPERINAMLTQHDSTWEKYQEEFCRFESRFSISDQQENREDNVGAYDQCLLRTTRQYADQLQQFENQWVKNNPPQKGPGSGALKAHNLAELPGLAFPVSDKGSNRPRPECSPLTNLPENAEVHLVAALRGIKSSTRQLADAKYPTRTSEVVVNRPDAKIVLVLSGNEPIIWAVRTMPRTEIVAVVLGGQYPQEVIGLPPGTPMQKYIATEFQGKPPECWKSFWFNGTKNELSTMIKKVENYTGRTANLIYLYPNNQRYIIGGSAGIEESALIFHAPKDSQTPVVFSRLPPGQEGLRELVRQGKIRPASKEDIESWVEAATSRFKKYNPDDSTKVTRHGLNASDSYAILGEVVLPDLKGVGVSSFIIPKGVPKPDAAGNRVHFYDVESGTCSISDGNGRCPE